MKRQLGILSNIIALTIPSVVAAQIKSQLSEERVICSLSGTCGDSQTAESTDASDQSKAVDAERAFTLGRRVDTTKPGATTQARFGSNPLAIKEPRPQQPGLRSFTRFTRYKKADPVVGAGQPSRSADMLVTFRSGSATMTPQAIENARLVARALQSPQLGNGQFLVEGHTDAVGNRAYNIDLSKRRAETVVEFLVKQGVPAARLKAEGFGFDRLRNPARPTDGTNRRVQIVKIG
jgi:OmpA-OmpF porin, OOP family